MDEPDGNYTIPQEKVILFSELRDALIGENRRRQSLIVPLAFGASHLKTKEELFVEKAFESCSFKTVLSSVMGFGLGGAIGLFTASVGPEMNVTSTQTQSVKEVFKDMKVKTLSYAKNFAILGAMFAAIECSIESVSCNKTLLTQKLSSIYVSLLLF